MPDEEQSQPDVDQPRRVTLEDFERFAETFRDAADPTVMGRAWRCEARDELFGQD